MYETGSKVADIRKDSVFANIFAKYLQKDLEKHSEEKELNAFEKAFHDLLFFHIGSSTVDDNDLKNDALSMYEFLDNNPSYLRVLDLISANDREDFIFSFNSINLVDADDFDFELMFTEHYYHYG
jgi:hypothetical protein